MQSQQDSFSNFFLNFSLPHCNFFFATLLLGDEVKVVYDAGTDETPLGKGVKYWIHWIPAVN